jgi:hypothetical protein
MDRQKLYVVNLILCNKYGIHSCKKIMFFLSTQQYKLDNKGFIKPRFTQHLEDMIRFCHNRYFDEISGFWNDIA